ncbi:MAG TPA: DNRLRE domain-containing protein [Fluviicola sp.]|nr:DNRLRE domain-containing protein [Fluviicola sp.]
MKPLSFALLHCVPFVLITFLGVTTFGQTTTTISITEDAHVYSASTGTNYETATTIPIWTVNTTDFYRYYLKPDLSSIPFGSHIVSASLRIKRISESGAGSSSFYLRGVAADWNESTITYANSNPPTTTGSTVTSSTVNLTTGRRSFNVATLVQSMVGGTILNYGFLITRNPETTANSSCTYYSGEDASSANWPDIVISYYPPIAITGATITPASTAIATDGSITPTFSGGSGSYSYKWFDLSTTSGYASALVGETALSISSRPPGIYGLEIKDVTLNKFYYMAFIVGVSCEQVDLDFYPGTKFMDDALVSAASPGGTGVPVTEIQASGNTGTDFRTFMRFRIWFEPGASPYDADLHLYGKSHINPGGGTTNDAEFQCVNSLGYWDEITVNYNTQPPFSNSIVVNAPPTSSSTESRDYDITAFCNYWKQNNTNNNFGMAFKLDAFTASTARQQYHSSDTSSDAHKPYIQFKVDNTSCDRTSYAVFKREPDAGYVSTFQGKLKVQFTEEYEQTAGKKMPLNLYDQNKTLVASISYDGTSGGTILPALTYQFDHNQYLLDLSTYSLTAGNYYILELIKSTGEKEYIRFVYAN